MPVPPRLQLLGQFRLTIDDESLDTVDTVRKQSLLAYLALRNEGPQPRSAIAFSFWPDSTEKQALTNLRHLLHELKGTLRAAPEILQITSKTLRWNGNGSNCTDVGEFESAIQTAENALKSGHRAEAITALETAAKLYTGELLPTCEAEWINDERERLRQKYCGVLQQLIRIHEDSRHYPDAIRAAKEFLRHEPTRESTHRDLIQLHMIAGDRSAALQAYRDCVETLQNELAVGPSQKTRDLHERLLADETIQAHPKVSPAFDGPEHSLQGRQTEWVRLREVWERASQGAAHLAALVGEAGIGKTRLGEELHYWVSRNGGLTARTRSFAAEGRLAYAPATQWLRTEPLRSELKNLEPAWLSELVRLLPEVRDEFPALSESASQRESWQQQHLLEALSRAVLARDEPLLLLLDDLQWTDLETLEWLRFLLRHNPNACLLIVVTIRVEELTPEHPAQRLLLDLHRDGLITQIPIGALSREETRSVAAEICGRPLEPEEAKRLHDETQGNPLFVVETVRAGLQKKETAAYTGPAFQKGWGAPVSSLPPKVHAVITTRLNQLSTEARDVAGIAAVLGRTFTPQILGKVYGRDEESIVRTLEELWQRRIIQDQGAGAYDFSHDKLRDVAYADIILPRRRMIHRRAAEVLEELHANDLDSVSAQLGAHYEEAGQPGQATDYYHRAAEAARKVYANDEAIRLFRKALATLEVLPQSSRRGEQELILSTKLGVCIVEDFGYPAAEVWTLHERAVALCEELGRPTDPPLLRVLALASLTIGDLTRARGLGEEFLRLYQNTKDPVMLVEGEYILGVTYHWLGQFPLSQKHLTASLNAYLPEYRPQHVTLYSHDPKAICLVRLGWSLWFQGYPDQAYEAAEKALGVAEGIQHPHTVGYTLHFAAQMFTDARETERAAPLLRKLRSITRDHPLAFWDNRGLVLEAYGRESERSASECEDAMRTSMSAYDADRCYVCFSHYYCYIAQLHLRAGEIDQGLGAIDEAFALMERIDERHYLAEIHRTKGELLAADGRTSADAEAAFAEALEVSKRQGAKMLELRTVLSMARYKFAHGTPRAEACKLVDETYTWFTEGFDTPDLREAKAFLASRE